MKKWSWGKYVDAQIWVLWGADNLLLPETKLRRPNEGRSLRRELGFRALRRHARTLSFIGPC